VTGRTEIHRIGAEKLTHINYAFSTIDENGEAFLPDSNAPACLARLQALKAKNPYLKILVSVGGWGADGFSDAALTEESRERFSRSVISMMERYALDGIDLDWEYPGQPGPGIKYRPEDKENFTLWLASIRAHVDDLSDRRGRAGEDRYLVTIASADREYFDYTEMDKVHQSLDFINIMAYDLFGSLTPITGHHAGLHLAPGAPPDIRTGDRSVKQHLDAGIPPEKLVLGVPFYGRGWAGVDPQNHAIYQPYERYAGDWSYDTLAREYIDKNGFVRNWDDTAKVPCLWNEESQTIISYEDPQSLKEKVAFVKENGLGGIMYWEQSHDPDGILLTTIRESLG
jgi:chitinase